MPAKPRSSILLLAHRSLLLALGLMPLLLLGVLPGAVSPPGPSAPTSAMQPAGHAATSVHPLVVLPPHPAPALKSAASRLAVNPYSLYSSEPAPMGIGDFGVDQLGNVYSYSTSTFVGTAAIHRLTLYNSGLGSLAYDGTMQLNVVLAFSSGSAQYNYWIQDVLYITTSTNTVQFEDNIWNFTAGNSQGMSSTSVAGNGSVYYYSGANLYYYADAAAGQAGNGVSLTYPATVQLRTVADITSGSPQVFFQYNDGYGWQTYDTVVFPFTRSVTSDAFHVDGSNLVNSYLFSNAELDFGGPGGGASTTMAAGDVNLTLQFDNGHNLQTVPNAFNFGSDTGEAIGQVIGSRWHVSTASGGLGSRLTSGSGSLQNLYDRSYAAIFNGTTVLPSGTYSINGTVAGKFRGSEVNLTLAPGSYTIALLVNGTVQNTANIVLTNGEYLAYDFNPAPRFVVQFESTGLAPGTRWSVSVGGTANASTTANLTFLLRNGSYTYRVGVVSGYRASPSTGPLTVLGVPTTVMIQFSRVLYSISFSEFGLPQGTSWSVSIAGIAHTSNSSGLNASFGNGSYPYVVGLVSGYTPSPSFGSIHVIGQASAIQITFARVYYPIQFVESGLPLGVAWIVQVGASNFSGASKIISTNLVNGSYAYYVSTGAPYTPTPAQAQLIVAGGQRIIPIQFRAMPAVIAGSVDPGSVRFLVNGSPFITVQGGSYSLTLPPGTYSIEVLAPGYLPYWKNLTIGAGQSLHIDIQLHAIPTTIHNPPPGNGPDWLGVLLAPTTLLILLGVGALVVVVLIALGTRRSPPPKS
jgi:hypothetical protein